MKEQYIPEDNMVRETPWSRMPFDDLVEYLAENSGEKVARFASGISGYYVEYSASGERFEVIAAGPQGIESEIAEIDKHNLGLLHTQADLITMVDRSESPL